MNIFQFLEGIADFAEIIFRQRPFFWDATNLSVFIGLNTMYGALARSTGDFRSSAHANFPALAHSWLYYAVLAIY